MAERKGQRSGQAGARVRAANPARGQADTVPDTVAALRVECARLKADLEAARAEVADLRGRQDDVLNRIDWVLDSLNTLAEDES